MALEVELVTPERRLFQTTADELTLQGALGQMTVLPGHVSMVVGLEPGALILRHAGSAETYAVGGGVAQIAQDKIIVLAESAESKDEIDVVRAEREKEEAQKALMEKSAYDAEFAETQAALARATTRIDVAKR